MVWDQSRVYESETESITESLGLGCYWQHTECIISPILLTFVKKTKNKYRLKPYSHGISITWGPHVI